MNQPVFHQRYPVATRTGEQAENMDHAQTHQRKYFRGERTGLGARLQTRQMDTADFRKGCKVVLQGIRPRQEARAPLLVCRAPPHALHFGSGVPRYHLVLLTRLPMQVAQDTFHGPRVRITRVLVDVCISLP